MSKRAKVVAHFDKIECNEHHAGFHRSLAELDAATGWKYFRQEEKPACNYSNFGRPLHDSVLMFKIIVLQRCYCLGEEQMEFKILDRRSFQQFLGLDGAHQVGLRLRVPCDHGCKQAQDERVPEGVARDLDCEIKAATRCGSSSGTAQWNEKSER